VSLRMDVIHGAVCDPAIRQWCMEKFVFARVVHVRTQVPYGGGDFESRDCGGIGRGQSRLELFLDPLIQTRLSPDTMKHTGMRGCRGEAVGNTMQYANEWTPG
jgi:hypothetical protein